MEQAIGQLLKAFFCHLHQINGNVRSCRCLGVLTEQLEPQLMQAFQAFDRDGNGWLDRKDLKGLLQSPADGCWSSVIS